MTLGNGEGKTFHKILYKTFLKEKTLQKKEFYKTFSKRKEDIRALYLEHLQGRSQPPQTPNKQKDQQQHSQTPEKEGDKEKWAKRRLLHINKHSPHVMHSYLMH